MMEGKFLLKSAIMMKKCRSAQHNENVPIYLCQFWQSLEIKVKLSGIISQKLNFYGLAFLLIKNTKRLFGHIK